MVCTCLRVCIPPRSDIVFVIAPEGDLVTVAHPMSEFMTTGKTLATAPGTSIDSYDGSIFVSDDSGFASVKRSVAYRRATVFRDGLDVEVLGFSYPEIVKNLRWPQDRILHYSLLDASAQSSKKPSSASSSKALCTSSSERSSKDLCWIVRTSSSRGLF